MRTEEIYRSWSLPQSDRAASLNMWDSMAPRFGSHEQPTIEDDWFLRLLSDNQMFDGRSRVLDVGCGTGGHAIALAGECESVVAVDFSDRMLDIARDRVADAGVTNVEFRQLDWHSSDLDELGYREAFDLVFARMTPAIQSADTFMKLDEASRGWCAMSKPTRRTDPVSDELKRLLNIEGKRETADGEIVYAFDLLWQRGLFPRFEYEKTQWNGQRSLEEAYGLYVNRLKSYRALTAEEEQTAKDYLESLLVDGTVAEQTDTTITTIYWQTKE